MWPRSGPTSTRIASFNPTVVSSCLVTSKLVSDHGCFATSIESERGHHLRMCEKYVTSSLQVTATTISDAKVREGFLTNIPEHREIVKAWAARQDAAK